MPGPAGQPYTSAGAWAACDKCAECIERGDRAGLLERHIGNKPREFRQALRPWARTLQRNFFANRSGPRTPTTRKNYLDPEAERERIFRESPALAVADVLTGIFGGGGTLKGQASDEPPMCDFDLARPIVWRYPCNDFTLYPLKDGKPWNSHGDWAACAACARVIEAGDIDELVERNMRAHRQEIETSLAEMRARGMSEREIRKVAHLPVTRAGLREMMAAFMAHRSGPRQPHEGAEEQLPTPSHEAQRAFGEQLKLLRLMDSPPGRRVADDIGAAAAMDIPTSFWTVPLRYGETYYWSREICELIRSSAEQLDPTPWTLTREALPSTSGFFYCESPVANGPTNIGPLYALAWTLAFDEMSGGELLAIDPQGRGSPDRAIGILLSWYVLREDVGRLSPSGLSIWRFGADHIVEDGQAIEIGFSSRHDDVTLNAIARRNKAALATMLAFIQQKILYPSRPHRPDRTTRKWAERERPEQAPVLRVVELRRRQRPDYVPPDEHREVTWQYQWLVRGFWRRQWYPSLDRHQPRWIAPYVKGPLDKPFKTPKPEIFIVDR